MTEEKKSNQKSVEELAQDNSVNRDVLKSLDNQPNRSELGENEGEESDSSESSSENNS